MNKKSDNIFSKECMILALKRLLKKKKLEDISVTELAAEAGVSRTTFYRNYTSIGDILEDYLEHYPFGVGTKESYDKHQFVFEERIRDSLMFLKQEQELINSMLNSGLEQLLYRNYAKLIKGLCRERAYEIGFRTEYELTAFTGMYYALCYEWIRGGMRESIDDMVDTCYSIMHRFYINDKQAIPSRDNVYVPQKVLS